MVITANSLCLGFSGDYTRLASLTDQSRELLAPQQAPLFTLGLRDRQGTLTCVTADQAGQVTPEYSRQQLTLSYSGFLELPGISVRVTVTGGREIRWNIQVKNRTDHVLEYADFPSVTFAGALKENGGDASILWPYNEGVLIQDSRQKPQMTEPEYPSQGNYAMFPYMVFAQFSLYLYAGRGICMALQDPDRGPKGIDFCCRDDAAQFRTRLYTGADFGADVDIPFDILWTGFEGDWHDGAGLYRSWFEEHLPPGLMPLGQREDLPRWYREDMPIVITYPVRGIHDMDRMTPNKLFPYVNVLPTVDRIARETGSTILVLLMHWEGTAPWAPPYVWPPYGGEAEFRALMDKLHSQGHLLGVYCSGSGYTKISNLIREYDMTEIIRDQNLQEAFCAGPDQQVMLSRICTAQRSGYDICLGNDRGYQLMNEALEPLLKSGVDYIQAMDQNHGGSMYFCYSRDHGHPPVPGTWMTDAASRMFAQWRSLGKTTLLGCESAAAEPYLPVLSISDNRYELNYLYGRPVPLYAFLYHKYLHNFMGNQVCCPIEDTTLGLIYRIAYSFLAGDLITLVINEDAEAVFHWGMRDFSNHADQSRVLSFVAQLQGWHRIFPDLFRQGEMVKPLDYTCAEMEIQLKEAPWRYREKAILSTAWRSGSQMVQLLVNYTEQPQRCTVPIPQNRAAAIRRNGQETARETTGQELLLAPGESAALLISPV